VQDNGTPLELAALRGRLGVVQRLLQDRRVNPNSGNVSILTRWLNAPASRERIHVSHRDRLYMKQQHTAKQLL
jgi:hypothetical protein